MTSTRLDGKRVLLTQSNDFMGPALTEVFRDSGAEVIADPRALDQDPALPAAIGCPVRVPLQRRSRLFHRPSLFGAYQSAKWHVALESRLKYGIGLNVFPISGGWANR